MPELPEVETTVSGLKKAIVGLIITDTWTDYKSTFHKGKDSIKDPRFFSYFKKEVTGKKVVGVTRRAKNILIHLSCGHTILVHMKMTGHLLYGDYDRKDPFNRFIHFILTFSNKKTLELSDMRKFAKVTLIPRDEGLANTKHLADIGPEPLEKDFTFLLFKERIKLRPNGKIKTVLMDQSIIAGIGNIYSDEALWRSGIHPERSAKNINETEMKKLFGEIILVLKKGIDFGGDSMSDYRNIHGERGSFQEKHQAYRKTNSHCTKPKCSGTIRRRVVNGRSAHFCDTHQK